MIQMPKTVMQWLKGLIAAVVGGAASAGSSWMGMALAHTAGFEVPELNFTALGIILISSGLASGLAYLAKSPVPPDDCP